MSRRRTIEVVGIAMGASLLAACGSSGGSGAPTAAASPTGTVQLQVRQVLSAEPAAEGSCPTSRAQPPVGEVATLCGWEEQQRVLYRLAPAAVTGDMVSAVSSASDGGGPTVRVSLTADGTAAFTELTATAATEQPPRNRVAIVTRGEVQNAPQVIEAIAGGEIVISGLRSQDEANALVAELAGPSTGG